MESVAVGEQPSASVDRHSELGAIKKLLWGSDIKRDIFCRWAQGFQFSHAEPSALEQLEGGPCAILAPVQAFILKNLLVEHGQLALFRHSLNVEMQRQVLIGALCEILAQCADENYVLVRWSGGTALEAHDVGTETTAPPASGSATASPIREVPAHDTSAVVGGDHSTVVVTDAHFHERLQCCAVRDIAEVRKRLHDHADQLAGTYGVLLFLYSVIASKGLESVKSEIDTSDPLIDSTYGYGSQSLINLLLTGKATTYVWDNEQNVGGLTLKGIHQQSQIGFITLMEHLRFCTVGSFYKNPVHPIWLLASDTHLTVLFSEERRLVSAETKSEEARRIFKSFDPYGNNFINAILLQDVLAALDLVTDEPYVEVMRKKLDAENLGIILLNTFMEEFFPKEECSLPDTFTLVHYNGLAQSNVAGRVCYHIGNAVLLETAELRSSCESNPMLTVLQTKWPNIEVTWNENVTPSLN